MWSLRREGRARFEVALARCSSRTPKRVRADLWLWFGVLHQFSDAVQSVRALRRAVALHRRAGDTFGTGYSLMRLANVLARTGKLDRAEHALEAARPLLSRTPLPGVMAPYFNAAGFVRKLAGDLAGARTHYEKSLSLFRSAGLERLAVEMLGSLADTNWALGALDAAVAGFRETIALMRGSNMSTKVTLGVTLTNLAGALVERGEFDEALSVAREGLELRKAVGDTSGALDHLALRAALVGRCADAARVTGYVDVVFATKRIVRQVNEARARARLDGLLLDRLDAHELAELMSEGATMTEDEACRLALAG
jgi:tetratricopeptide (TPR) repeat protein